jgi:hypothetical protein
VQLLRGASGIPAATEVGLKRLEQRFGAAPSPAQRGKDRINEVAQGGPVAQQHLIDEQVLGPDHRLGQLQSLR